jgi:hypothetical protein
VIIERPGLGAALNFRIWRKAAVPTVRSFFRSWMKSRLAAGVVVRLFESGSERRLSEFLIGTSNQSEILRENVGFQFLSLRQYVRVQNSPLACEPAEIAN